MSNSFKVKEFSFVLTLVIIFIFYNQYNSPKHSPQPEQVKSKKIDEELIKAINLLKDQVFFLNEEIKEIKGELESKSSNNYGNDQILLESSDINNNFYRYPSDEIVKPLHIKISGNQNQTYNESQQDALELLKNTDIFENIPEVDE